MSCGASEVVSIVCVGGVHESAAEDDERAIISCSELSRRPTRRMGPPPNPTWRCPLQREIEDFSRANIGPSAQQPSFRASTIMDAPFTLSPQHGRSLQGGDLGDTLAILLILTISFIGVCAFLGWYSRRRG